MGPHSYEIEPVTPDRWDDLVALFGDNGAYANCWCMWWRVSATEFDAGARDRGARNRAGMERLVAEGREPGLLAYPADGDGPVGWVSVAPRDEFARVLRSPVIKPIDDEPAWAVVCFYIPRAGRGRGVGHALLHGAVDHAVARGARLIEGYPVDPSRTSFDAASIYTGTVPMFEKAGFVEAARRRPDGRVVMRKFLAHE